MSSVINWFDIPATNFERAVKFYETILDIRLMQENMLGARMAIFPAKAGEATGAGRRGTRNRWHDHLPQSRP